jgi:hypothetical protein
MPYIKQDQRNQWDKTINSLVRKIGFDSGKLRYVLIEITNKLVPTKTYANYERAFGFLNCVRLEYNRRVPYYYQLEGAVPIESFDMSKESRQIDTMFVHDIDKDAQGGHLNFLVSSVISRLLVNTEFSRTQIGLVLHDVTNQYYIETIGPYEDIKIEENGDVYDPNVTTLAGPIV